MEIRRKLTLQFTGIVALIVLFALVIIYFLFAQARKEEFYDRLGNKAKLVAQMLIDIDEIDSELLKKIERNNPLSLPNEKIVIYDYQDKKIFSSDDQNELLLSQEKIQQVRLTGNARFKQNGYEIFGQFYTGKFDRIIVFAAATDIFGLNKLKRLRLIMLMVYLFSLGFVYYVGHLFSVRALAPISKIVKQVNQIEISTLNEKLDEGNKKDEIAHLAQTFNKMLERLEKSFQLQKSFIASASHELRTPLTIITGQLEVVLMKARSNEDYQKTLSLILDEIKDLNELSNKLLMLAQTSSDKNELNFSPVRIDDVLWKARQEVLTRNSNYIVEMSFSENINDDSMLTVNGNELLLKTVLVNLMENACKFSGDHTARVLLDTVAPNLIMKFIDHGTGIHPDEISLIFMPFYRSKNAIAPGHGIGLSLVQNIIQQHHGQIEVYSKVGKGSVFTVKIPFYP